MYDIDIAFSIIQNQILSVSKQAENGIIPVSSILSNFFQKQSEPLIPMIK